ncbi:MAG TPA: hypothetical protein VKV28_00180 [Candidatus Binataceae bacterium]|nr:hypothetical protein [Candidatus Binataceae bacterium]
MAARLEFDGRLVKPAELRVTPRGQPVLRAWVRCDDGTQPLVLEVVLLGEVARELGSLRAGETVWGEGELRAVTTRLVGRQAPARLEVVASLLRPGAR